VRGTKHVIKRGKTTLLTPDDGRKVLDSIDVSTLVGLRDRALIALMAYSFARVSGAVGMRVEDYFAQGERWWVRLDEKGGKRHQCENAPKRGSDAILVHGVGYVAPMSLACSKSVFARPYIWRFTSLSLVI